MNQKQVNLRPAPIAFTPQNLSLAEGVRAGIAVAATLLAGDVLNLPDFGLAALGALLTCFADPGGPLQRRAPAVIAFALFSGVYFSIFGYLSGINVVLAAALAGAAIFGNAYARIYGQGGLQVGNLLSVATVIAIGNPAHSLADAAAQGLNFCAGAAWAALLTLAIWRLHPYQPARQALAVVARALAALAKDLARLAAAEESVAAFEAHAATHRRAVREAIEAARTIAMEIFRRRGLATPRGAQTTLRLNTLEQIFGRLIALSDALEEADVLTRARAGAPLRRTAGWLSALGPDMVADRKLDGPKKQASLQRLRDAAAPLDEALRKHFDAIAENFAVLLTISAATEPAATPAPAQPGLRTRILSPLRANWNVRDSAAMRHALRAACIATPTLILSVMYGGPFAHWATITMVLCLNPYFSATWTRTAERVAGTALGGVAAALFGLFAQTRTELAIVMLPLTMFAFSIRTVNYGLFVAALTPMIVLLIEQIAPGADEAVVAAARVGYTLLGGGLAVAGNLLLWPDFEGQRLETSVAAAVAAHVAFVEAVFRAILEAAPPPDAQRRAAGLASNNLEAAISRALLEPHGADSGLQRAALTDAALRRLAGRLSGLALERPEIPATDLPHWLAWKSWLIASLSAQPHGPRPPLPDHPAGAAFTRLARQVELLGS
jgi:uncharacterized membrane protein YccC